MTLEFSSKCKSVIVVDGHDLSTKNLPERFASLGAQVHVAADPTVAAMLVANKHIDVVFLGHRPGQNEPLKRVVDAYLTSQTARPPTPR